MLKRMEYQADRAPDIFIVMLGILLEQNQTKPADHQQHNEHELADSVRRVSGSREPIGHHEWGGIAIALGERQRFLTFPVVLTI